MKADSSSPVETSGASGSPVSSSGKAAAKAQAPVMVEVAPAAKAAAPAPVAAQPVITPRRASSQPMVNPEPSKPLEYSPGVAELSPAERRAAFMAAGQVTKPEPKVEQPEAKEAAEDPEVTPEATEATEVTAEATPAGEADPETDLVTGLAKVAETTPALKALLKRTQHVLKQNSDRGKAIEALKTEVETLRAQPVEVLAASADSPLAHVTTEAAVDAEVRNIVADARTRIRWLENHLEDGGVWQEGKPHEQTMTADDVARALNYYEDLRDSAAELGKTRKAELAEYAATLKTLGVPAEDLVKPTVPTRESKFAAKVPEIRRDPAWLQFLADAKAGREAREEQARGVQVVKLDPAKAKAKPAPGSKASDDRPQREAVESTQTTDLDALRTKAATGDFDARMAMRRAFVQKVA